MIRRKTRTWRAIIPAEDDNPPGAERVVIREESKKYYSPNCVYPYRGVSGFIILLLIFLSNCAVVINAFLSQPIVRQFNADPNSLRSAISKQTNITSVSNTTFSHMQIDHASGNVYIAGPNVIFQLNPDLQAEEFILSGPQLDSEFCTELGSCLGNRAKIPTVNYNKALILDQTNRILIACGSLLQGICERYELSQIASRDKFDTALVPIAPNDASSSMVAFVAPGPQLDGKRDDKVLYVASTYTEHGPSGYRTRVPLLSARLLTTDSTSALQLNQQVRFKKPEIKIESKYLTTFKVHFVHGFYHDGFAYWITVQPRNADDADQGYVSKIVRVCANDLKFQSYMEVTLNCSSRGKDYNLVQAATTGPIGRTLKEKFGLTGKNASDDILIASFAASSGQTSTVFEDSSAVCAFTLDSIKESFIINANLCLSGGSRTGGLGYIAGGNRPCRKGTHAPNADYCTKQLMIEGTTPVKSEASIVFPNELVTSIALTLVDDHTISLLGTKSGALKKVHMQEIGVSKEFSSLQLDGEILPDMKISADNQFIYALTKTTVYKVEMSQCSQYTTCDSCLQASDPFCGWCTLEAKCTARSDCREWNFNNQWLPFNAQQCVEFAGVEPESVPVEQVSSLQLDVKNLPQPLMGFAAEYYCVLGEAAPTPATLKNGLLVCDTPSPMDMRILLQENINETSDYTSLPLSLRSAYTKRSFLSRKLNLFDCARHSTCRDCSSSEWGCSWCVADNRCSNSRSCSTNDSSIQSADQCPFIQRREIFLPDSQANEIVLSVANLPRLPDNVRHQRSPFKCVVTVEDANHVHEHIIDASYDSSKAKITCSETLFSYQHNVDQVQANIALLWSDRYTLDSVPAVLYKCRYKGPDCSTCKTQDPKYGCVWEHRACRYSASPLMRRTYQNGECPKPSVLKISPNTGPIKGGTLVEITGVNMGMSINEIENGVTLANVPCTVVHYEVSRKIVCRTGEAPSSFTGGVSVRVKKASGSLVESLASSVMFNYKEVYLTGISPQTGPQAGGTLVTIEGANLDIGTSRKVEIGGLPCNIEPENIITSRFIQCRTGGAPRPSYSANSVQLEIDNERKTDERLKFQYYDDPQIFGIDETPLDSVLSGGMVLRVYGTFPHPNKKTKIIVYDENDDESVIAFSVCQSESTSMMLCPSPSLTELNSRLLVPSVPKIQQQSERITLNLAFALDAWRSNLSEPYSTITYSPDPEFNSLLASEADPNPDSDTIPTLYKNEALFISGEKLNLALQPKDFLISIGSEKLCNVTSLNYYNMTCVVTAKNGFDETELRRTFFPYAPRHEAYASQQTIEPIPEELLLPVHLQIASNSRKIYLGDIKLHPNTRATMAALAGSPLATIGGIAALLVIIITAFSIVALLVYRRRSSRAEREYRKIQLRMDTLESSVRNECKQAFAELQTHMQLELASDDANLDSSKIPWHENRVFLLSSFFHVQGSVYEHPILKRDSASRCCNAHPDSRSLDDAMVEFEQLLLNKSFLLTLIDTLERQPLITISERSNIASLLTVVLMGQQLDYLSEVLKMLLTRLIEQSVASRQPKLMLRRCDSLCEKLLSNWLALAQHDGIRNGAAGKSLFLMYKAVKHQVESGPVDAVTHQARYSLSEQRLLREKVDALPIMLYLQHPSMCATNAQGEENIYATPPVQCRVLNCDTVKQVKIKLLDALYGNSPARFRTSHNDVDLEWIHASHGAITLKDDDASSERDEFGCVRINTLQHYGMREQAVVSLVFRNTCSAQSSACGHCSSSSASSTSSCSASSSPATYSLSSTPQLLLPQGGGANCHVMGSSSGVSSASCQACSNADIYQRTRNCRHATIARYEQKQSNKKKWHLVRPDYGCQSMLLASYDKHSNIYLSSKRGQEYPFPKQISPPSSTSTIAELYLTRLLSTKGTLQQFIDDFFNQALSTDKNSGAVSPGLKWLFDIYDSAALDLDIGDDVVHAWKSNSLNLRFWSNIINNPDFIFDVEKSSSVDSCLTVIAQTLMDACSQNEHIRLGKDSPSSKLLFAKDIPRYRAMVKKFYAAIREQPVVEGDKLNRWLHSISTKYSSDLNTMHALKELYSYTSKYETELVELLDDDPMCRRMNLSHKLDAISASLSYYTVPRLPINQSLTMRSHKTNPGIAMGVQSYSNCLTLSSRATNNNTILLPTGNKTLQPALIMPPPPNSHPPICTQAFQYQTHYPARN